MDVYLVHATGAHYRVDVIYISPLLSITKLAAWGLWHSELGTHQLGAPPSILYTQVDNSLLHDFPNCGPANVKSLACGC